jgi:hypothetical protein
VIRAFERRQATSQLFGLHQSRWAESVSHRTIDLRQQLARRQPVHKAWRLVFRMASIHVFAHGSAKRDARREYFAANFATFFEHIHRAAHLFIG